MADDAVAVGGNLQPRTLLRAYSTGLFPMHIDGTLVWWRPEHRGVLRPSDFRVTASLRRARNHFTATVDGDFAAVLEGCGDPKRPHGWINQEIRDAYTELHRLGHAHSVEIWQGDDLAGGLYGVSIGGLFAAESMFHRARDASKVAVWHLARIVASGGARSVIDVQWLTPHLSSLGCTEVGADDYSFLLTTALEQPGPDWAELARNGRTRPAPGD